MAKRRTSGIQRRERASEDALNRRLDAPSSGMALPDWRLLAIGGVFMKLMMNNYRASGAESTSKLFGGLTLVCWIGARRSLNCADAINDSVIP